MTSTATAPPGAGPDLLAAPEAASSLSSLLDVGGDLAGAVPELVRLAPAPLGTLGNAYLRASRVLDDGDLSYLRMMAQDALRAASLCLDRTPGALQLPADAAAELEVRVQQVCLFLQRREGERSRRQYARSLLGAMWLSIAVLLLVGGVGFLVMKTWVWVGTGKPWASTAVPAYDFLGLRDALVTIGGGAAGAVVSVLLRLHRIPQLKFETVNTGAARYRVILGWFFAAALLFLVKGGIATNLVNDPSAPLIAGATTPAVLVSSWFFWGGLGFIAGFNERWATNIISREPGAQLDEPAPQSGSAASTTAAVAATPPAGLSVPTAPAHGTRAGTGTTASPAPAGRRLGGLVPGAAVALGLLAVWRVRSSTAAVTTWRR